MVRGKGNCVGWEMFGGICTSGKCSALNGTLVIVTTGMNPAYDSIKTKSSSLPCFSS